MSAQNAAGTQSPPTSGKFTIDTRPPVTTVSISSDTDSGVIGDYLTNNINPVLTGVTKHGAVVTLTLDGKVFQLQQIILAYGRLWSLHHLMMGFTTIVFLSPTELAML